MRRGAWCVIQTQSMATLKLEIVTPEGKVFSGDKRIEKAGDKLIDVVPLSVPPLGLVPMASVTLSVALVTVLPNASRTVTCTAGLIATPPLVLLGCTVKASWLAAAGVMPARHAARLDPVDALRSE